MIHSESTCPVIVFVRKCWYVEEMETCSSGGGTARSDVCAHVGELSWLPLVFHIVIVRTNEPSTIFC